MRWGRLPSSTEQHILELSVSSVMTRATRSPRRAILHPGICWTRVEEEPALETRLREAA